MFILFRIFVRIEKYFFALALVLILSGCALDKPATKESDGLLLKQPPTKQEPERIKTYQEEESGQRQDNKADFISPLNRARERVSKKPFGIKISPQTSPVQPERFSGYHTGIDFEIFSDELTKDVGVRAFCQGKLTAKQVASGYGGVVVQACLIDGEPVTAIYGHLDIKSVTAAVGEYLTAGEIIGDLGDDKSEETGGERKHLHFGLHKGTDINIRGYVSKQYDLADWLDPFGFIN